MPDLTVFSSRAVDAAVAWSPRLLAAAVILVLGWFLSKLVAGLVRRVLRKGEVDATITGFVRNVVYFLVLAFFVVAALGKLGVDTTSFAAIIAAAGLAIGLALQGSLGNFASGFLIILLRPFKAGDFVEAGGTSGIVEEISVFATRLRTPDNREVIVPNAAITGGTIVNYSARHTRRIDLVFGIGYGDDIGRAREILEKLLADDSRILSDPAPVIAVSELADSSVNFVVRPWVASSDYWDVAWGLNEKVKLAFDQAGISIPFPQRDVHLHQVA